jgi:hypothetical protein
MNRKPFIIFAAGAFGLAVSVAMTACGGSQEPAESPEAAPAAPAESATPSTDGAGTPAPAGEHTMPDGTKMDGQEHGDAAEGEHKH